MLDKNTKIMNQFSSKDIKTLQVFQFQIVDTVKKQR
jgi:hypothetical protein